MSIKFKPKSKKSLIKRVKLSSPLDSSKAKLTVTRINYSHKLVVKSGEKKLRKKRETTLSKITNKYKKYL